MSADVADASLRSRRMMIPTSEGAMPSTAKPYSPIRWRAAGSASAASRSVAEETPIAIVHDGSTSAVMMATPADLEDFAIGFSLTEGIIDQATDVRSVDVIETDLGIELRLWLARDCASRLIARRRRLVGPTGCGLCGIESLQEALKPPRRLGADAFKVGSTELLAAMAAVEEAQVLGRQTRAVHAAALWTPGGGLTIREDVGRHNALDKLVGAAAAAHLSNLGIVLLTSRVSVEMVQKTIAFGAPVLCAVSAPTALAIDIAEAANLTLVGVARKDGFEVFTHPHRLLLDS